MLRVMVLGTAGSAPTRTRRMPSVVLTYEGELLMFDCGEGTQFQMLEYGLNPVKITAIFLTHIHGDHSIGIAGLIRTMALNSRVKPLLVFVPAGQEAAIKSLIVFDRAMINYPIIVKGIRAGVVYRGRGYAVSAFPVRHGISTYGYAFKENDRLRFDKEAARRLGIKGPMFSELQKRGSIRAGKKIVRLGSITTKQIGKKVVYATDTRPSKSTIEAARDADLLIHESAFAEKERRLARQRGHSTAAEAAAVAKTAHVKALILTHASARYKNANVLLAEAKKIFGNATMAHDGYAVDI